VVQFYFENDKRLMVKIVIERKEEQKKETKKESKINYNKERKHDF